MYVRSQITQVPPVFLFKMSVEIIVLHLLFTLVAAPRLPPFLVLPLLCPFRSFVSKRFADKRQEEWIDPLDTRPMFSSSYTNEAIFARQIVNISLANSFPRYFPHSSPLHFAMVNKDSSPLLRSFHFSFVGFSFLGLFSSAPRSM